MIVYMAVSSDKYELPLAIADTVKELSDKTGVKRNIISSRIYHNSNGRYKGFKFIKVNIDDST